jgi:hypothetical protein
MDELLAKANEISSTLCATFGINNVAIEIEGNTTRVKFQRVREGYKIVCGLKAFMVPKYKFIIRLIRELVHVFHDENFIVDTCGNGAYHSEVFAKKAAEWGLFCTWNKSYGFAGQLDLRADFLNVAPEAIVTNLTDFLLPTDTRILYKAPKESKPRESSGRGGFKAKIYKVVCPVCDEILYIQKDQVVTEEAYLAQQNPPAAVKQDPEVAGADLMA